MSQREVAAELGVRQGTISHLEQGVTAPHWAMVVELCKFYDVTPTFLADESRGVVPRITERWGLRDSLVGLGMWVELDPEAIEELDDGKARLCQVRAGSGFFDDEAAAIRRRYKRPANCRTALEKHRAQSDADERELETRLAEEMSTHPRRRGKAEE